MRLQEADESIHELDKQRRRLEVEKEELQAALEEAEAALEASQRESRNYNSEVFRLRAGWEEINEQLDAVKREGGLRWRRRSCKLPLRRLRLLLSKKKTRLCVLNLIFLKLSKRLIEGFKRRKKSLKIPGRTMLELWIPCRPPLRQRPEPRLKL